MASADYQQVILIDSEDEDFYFSDVLKENMEISYEDYIKKRSGMNKETERATKKLFSTCCALLKDIEVLLIRKNGISHYTPIGAAAKTFSVEFKEHARKLSFATAIDAAKRSEALEKEIENKRTELEGIVASVNSINPSFRRPVPQTETFPKKMRIIKSTPAASHSSVVSVDSVESTSKCLPGSTADIPQSVPAAVIAVSATQRPLD
ncbi:hypothetical protein DAPPUDRAFT_320323 [Daphnia pulex]|uniref:Uncharacterized protein n=1 Tax=Daphnia pulex TaxID=6669 RepID=E9GPJ1_DAPPU|nr:hypothetical protein DAPPUDRAFT_320323 [Daphnia pulex]|eukprot:EFX78668.1 hypothetical protein DAPPUDRAFT_320323 [Daphnia pulex]